MHNVPNHIKFIYIMVLKHNYTMKHLLRRSMHSWEIALNLASMWDDGEAAERLEQRVRDFIRKYVVAAKP